MDPARRERAIGGGAGLALPPSLEEYRLIQPLGRGAMGQVFLAHDALLDRPVAIKFLAAVDPSLAARERFFIEARAAARLSHPNVVAIHRVGAIEGLPPFIVSELIRGQSLDRLPRPVAPARALELGIGLARGLAAAHRRGVLHRDIKPANAMLGDDGEVKLLDFGLAKLIEPSSAVSSSASASAQWLAGAAAAAAQAASLAPARPSAAPGAAPVPLALEATVTATGDSNEPISDGQLTAAGAILGTPYFMAPETLRGEPATRTSDVYSLGALLYDLLAGAAPFRHVAVRELADTVAATDARPLAELVPGIDPRFAQVIERCLRREPAERWDSGDAVREALEALVAPASARAPEGNPYRGLAPFEAEHRALYFGRARDVRAVVERVRGEPLVVVAGESGVGKSSLCRAGVLPALAEGALADGRTWETLTLSPGRRPLTALAAALAARLGRDEGELERELASDPAQVARALRVAGGAARGLVLFVDQLEELVTMADPAQAAAFDALLAQLVVPSPAVRLLASVRADHLARVARLPGIGGELTRALYLLRPMPAGDLRDAVVGPARAAGVSFESEALIDVLVDAGTAGGAGLPVLQFALAELWEERDAAARVIRAAALERIGGVTGALARHADGLLARLPAGHRELARTWLVSMVAADGTRVRRSEDELGPDGGKARELLDALVRGRLLVAREDGQRTSYELVHEALARDWGTLRRWLDDDAGERFLRDRLARAGEEWERLGRARDGLLGARQLRELASIDDAALPPRSAALLAASRRAGVRSRRKRLGLALLAALALGGTALGVRLQSAAAVRARVVRELDGARALLADARRIAAEGDRLRAAALVRFDAHDRAGGDEAWTPVLERAALAERRYAEATNVIEAALMTGGEHDADGAARNLLADVIYERALAAERDHRAGPLADLLQRLELHDRDGSRRARWNAPATLALAADPPDATLALERLELDEAGRERRTPVAGVPARAPAELRLPPGSYLLTLAAPGRVTVRYPVLLTRGETLPARLRLPLPAQVPDGFVYVPPGRFLVGSDAEDSQRRDFFCNAPLHALEGHGYLIARHETTYAEWITWLDTLPAGERARRAPRTATTGMQGDLALERSVDGSWRLRLQSGEGTISARAGEPIRYPGRRTRAEQDWLRLPVSGIAWGDAAAYAAWLKASGRVPGARLCDDHEWERAARGADGRRYPHGNQLAAGDANWDQTYDKQPGAMGPDMVGSYPQSRSLFGVDDLAGNVFEWTTSPDEGETWVVRGGTFAYDASPARADFRDVGDAAVRDVTVGLRVCADFQAGP